MTSSLNEKSVLSPIATAHLGGTNPGVDNKNLMFYLDEGNFVTNQRMLRASDPNYYHI